MTISELARLALAFLGTYALHSTLLLLAVWALCSARRSIPPRLAERLWRLGLIGGLLSAGAQTLIGARPLLGRFVLEAPARELASPASEEARPQGPLSAPLRAGRPAPPALSDPDRLAARSVSTGPANPRPRPLGARPVRARTNPRMEHGPSAEDAASAPADSAAEPVASATPPTAREHPSGDTLADAGGVLGSDPAPGAVRPVSPASPGALARALAALRAWPWARLAFLVWAAPALLLVAGILISWSGLHRRLRRRVVLADGPLVERVEELRRRAGLRAPVRLSVSKVLSSPISLGIFRPEICIPAAAVGELNRAQQTTLLAHETAHLLRRDPAWFALYCLVERVFFFQPLNRVARARLEELAEVACDDWAVRWTGERLALASCLTEVAQWILGERRRALPVPGLTSSRSRLGRRVERLLDDRRSPSIEPRARWWPAAVLAMLGLFVLAVPGISASLADAEQPARTAEPASPGAEAPDAPALEPRSAATIERAPRAPELPAESAPARTDPVPPLAAPDPAGPAVEDDRELLETEMRLLESEIEELRAELARTELLERFAGSLELIERRMSELRARRERADVLLEQLTALDR